MHFARKHKDQGYVKCSICDKVFSNKYLLKVNFHNRFDIVENKKKT